MPVIAMNHERFMKRALEEASMAFHAGEFPVGCVVVYRDEVIAVGSRSGTAGDPAGDFVNEIDHAEVSALKRLSQLEVCAEPGEMTMYVTLEPCLMCFGAILISGVRNIVYAYEDAMGGGTGCNLSAMPPLYKNAGKELTIVPGVLREESLKLFKSYFSKPENAYLRDTYLATYTLSQTVS